MTKSVQIEILPPENGVTIDQLESVEEKTEDKIEDLEDLIEENIVEVENNQKDMFEWLQENLIAPMGQTLAILTDKMEFLAEKMGMLEAREMTEAEQMTEQLTEQLSPTLEPSEGVTNSLETTQETSNETKMEAQEKSEDGNPVQEVAEILDKPGREILKL